jgi:hypothetical protein
MWNTVQENYAWDKILRVWIFLRIVGGDYIDASKYSWSEYFILLFVNRVELFLSEGCQCFFLNYLLWWKNISCVVPMIYCWRSDSKAVPAQVVVKMPLL